MCFNFFSIDDYILQVFNGNAQFVQKVTFEPLISNKTIMKVANITEAATFKYFLQLSY